MRGLRPSYKWLFLGLVGFAGGFGMLLFFRSLRLATGTAAGIVVGILVLKHLALVLAVSSPLAGLLQLLKPKLRALCGRAPDPDD